MNPALKIWKLRVIHKSADMNQTMAGIRLGEIDNIYRNMSPNEIPWNMEVPPAALIELVESGAVKPFRTIDLGCGIGNYAIDLANKGFEVTGVELSPTAIKMAKENAKKEKGAKINFLVADVLGGLNEIRETFDFAYDWELLHHLFPDEMKNYVRNVHKIQILVENNISLFVSMKMILCSKVQENLSRFEVILFYISHRKMSCERSSSHAYIKELKVMEIIGNL